MPYCGRRGQQMAAPAYWPRTRIAHPSRILRPIRWPQGPAHGCARILDPDQNRTPLDSGFARPVQYFRSSGDTGGAWVKRTHPWTLDLFAVCSIFAARTCSSTFQQQIHLTVRQRSSFQKASLSHAFPHPPIRPSKCQPLSLVKDHTLHCAVVLRTC